MGMNIEPNTSLGLVSLVLNGGLCCVVSSLCF